MVRSFDEQKLKSLKIFFCFGLTDPAISKSKHVNRKEQNPSLTEKNSCELKYAQ